MTKVKCPFCGKEYTKNGLSKHINSKHPDEYDKWKTSEKKDNSTDNTLLSVKDNELEVLKDIEKLLNKKFSVVEQLTYETKMGITVKKKKVTGIGLANCNLSSLPESIGDLSSLEVLSLYENNLSSLPDSFKELKTLLVLSIIGNEFTVFPDSICNFKSLLRLDCNNNNIASLPDTIGNLSSLKILWMNDNQLKKLPVSIGNLSSLEQLWLGNNMISSLPNSITKLSNLQILWLNNNKLKSLPTSIGDLESLKSLGIGENKISTLPKSIDVLRRVYSGPGMRMDNTIFVHESIEKPLPPLAIFLDETSEPITIDEARKELKKG